MQISESVRVALASVAANKLRSALTLLSVSIGVFAILGAGTVVDSLNGLVTDQLESIGSSTFLVQKFPAFFLNPREWRKYMRRKDITYEQIQLVKQQATLSSSVGCQAVANYYVRGGGQTTDAPVSIIGGDETVLANQNFVVHAGRVLTLEDVQYRRDVAVLGADVVKRLFEHEDPIGKQVSIHGRPYVVIGTLEAKGTTFGQSQDNFVHIPITSYLKYYTSQYETSLTMVVKAVNVERREEAMDQVVGILRTARRVPPGVDNDFEIFTSESISETFAGFTKYLVYFAIGVSSISLLAAGVGIMNIMLVSVKERTREIGTRKAVGATRRNILTQFMLEAVTLCELGAVIGIVLGIVAGNAFAAYLGTKVVLPYGSIALAVGVCTIIGVCFGAYPAWRAASLDPIDALRYE